MTKSSRVDPEWLRRLLDEYETQLIRYARRITGDIESARDAVQETFLRLCGDPPDNIEEYIAPWLFRVCRTRALDLRKARKPEDGEDRLLQLRSEGDPPSDVLLRKEQLAEVAKLLDLLPVHQQEVIRLKFQHGFSYKEIAEITGLSVSNVGFLIHVGIRTIKNEIVEQAPPKERAFRRIK